MPYLNHSNSFFSSKPHVRQRLFVDQIYRRLWRMNRSSSDKRKKGRRAIQVEKSKDHHGQRLGGMQTAWCIEETSRNIPGTWHEKPRMPQNEVGLKIKRDLSWMSLDTMQTKALTSPWRPENPQLSHNSNLKSRGEWEDTRLLCSSFIFHVNEKFVSCTTVRIVSKLLKRCQS